MCFSAKKNEKVHECVYDDITYKNGELIQIDNYLQCICSPDFNGNNNNKWSWLIIVLNFYSQNVLW